MNNQEKRELAFSKILLIVLAVVGLGTVVWLAWVHPSEKAADVQNFAECVDAGNKVDKTKFPEVCTTSSGQQFLNPNQIASEDLAASKYKVTQTTVLKTSEELRKAIIAETKKRAPTCVQDGKLVDANKQPVDPTITHLANGYVITTIGCNGGVNVLLERHLEGSEGVWRLLEAPKDSFSCEILTKADVTKELFQKATGVGTCLDGASGQQRDIDTLRP